MIRSTKLFSIAIYSALTIGIAPSFSSSPLYLEEEINLHTLQARLDAKGVPEFKAEGHRQNDVDPNNVVDVMTAMFVDPVFKEDILNVTLNIYGQMDHDQDVFLALGRTPHAIELSLRKFLSLRGKTTDHIKSICFSGTPDIENMRPHCKDNERRNIITPQALDCFERYLDRTGLGTVKGTLWICDIIGTGSNMNSFLRILRHYYEKHLAKKVPHIKLFALNLPPVNSNIKFVKSETDTIIYIPQTQKLSFVNKKAVQGFERIVVDCYGLNIRDKTQEILDGLGFSYLTCKGVVYPAYRWTKTVEECAEEDGTGSYHDYLLECVDLLVGNFYDKGFRKMADLFDKKRQQDKDNASKRRK